MILNWEVLFSLLMTVDQAAKLDTSIRGEGGSGESYIGGKSKWNYRKLK